MRTISRASPSAVSRSSSRDADSPTRATTFSTGSPSEKRAVIEVRGPVPLAQPERSLALELHVLVGGGVGVVGDQGEARFRHARPVPVEEGQLPDGDDRRLLVDELLDALEDRLALLPVHLSVSTNNEGFGRIPGHAR